MHGGQGVELRHEMRTPVAKAIEKIALRHPPNSLKNIDWHELLNFYSSQFRIELGTNNPKPPKKR